MTDDRPADGCPVYPPIGDYALLSDCHSVALVSRHGSIDWCCMPRMDAPSLFGRLLDWRRGGYCCIRPEPVTDCEIERRYLPGSLVLETRFRDRRGEIRLLDCMAMRPGGREEPYRQVLRIVEGVEGEMEVAVDVAPRFVYGEIRAWLRHHAAGFFTAIGGDAGLILCTDLDLRVVDRNDVSARLTVREGDRYRLSMEYERPHRLHPHPPRELPCRDMDERFDATVEWWERWSSQATWPHGDDGVLASAAVIKGLTNAPTGAIVAAATTSLPEALGGPRNWDYRYSWIRDSSFALEALGELGFHAEAHGFRDFVERTTAGDHTEVQPLYGVGGEHFLPEVELDWLEGYRGSRPVRIGNGAYDQLQLDAHGELLELAWRASLRGHPPDDDYWQFLCDLVEAVCERWQEPDRGFWEVRDGDHHFVHSKVTCWAAMDRGVRLAQEHELPGPVEHWKRVRRDIREAILEGGVSREHGSFVRELGGEEVDASLLLVPRYDFVDYDDERMVRTADRVRDELSDRHGLVRRYRAADGLGGDEGAFIACTFWLAEVLALQGRRQEARQVFDRAAALRNDLGLLSEEWDGRRGEMLGNYPQGLSHYSYVTAAVALERGEPAKGS